MSWYKAKSGDGWEGEVPIAPPCFGANLRAARQRAEMTLRQVARLVGVTNQTVSGWERGKHSVSEAEARKAAEAVRVPYEELCREPDVG